jgi:hypothetical protein
MPVSSAINLNPLLAMSVADLVIQAVIVLVAIGLYHVWVSGRKPIERPSAAVPEPPKQSVPPVPAAPIAVVSQAVPGPVPPVAATTVDSTPAEIAAVIAAAVAVVFARPHRVVSVHYIGVSEARFNVWAHEGRQRIFDSHKFR